MQFPILDRECGLAGWTASPPRYQGTELRHEEAEQIVGRPLIVMPVRVLAEGHAKRCGANFHEKEGGWCLAIAPTSCIPLMPITINADAA